MSSLDIQRLLPIFASSPKNRSLHTAKVDTTSNKQLARMAGIFPKPDQIHTCGPEGIAEKCSRLPLMNGSS